MCRNVFVKSFLKNRNRYIFWKIGPKKNQNWLYFAAVVGRVFQRKKLIWIKINSYYFLKACPKRAALLQGGAKIPDRSSHIFFCFQVYNQKRLKRIRPNLLHLNLDSFEILGTRPIFANFQNFINIIICNVTIKCAKIQFVQSLRTHIFVNFQKDVRFKRIFKK
jgi:hypothetical protein